MKVTYKMVLVPFYRGAVVFKKIMKGRTMYTMFSSPFIEERLYFVSYSKERYPNTTLFSSPFIEERLYLILLKNTLQKKKRSRPLLSRSGCIYGLDIRLDMNGYTVLVPFYRGAVVFRR